MSAIEDVIAKVVFDLSQLEQKSWFEVVRRVIIESQEMGRREARAELAQLRAERDGYKARSELLEEQLQAEQKRVDSWLAAQTAGSDATTLDERM
jgi:hypothetical protein